MSLLMIIGFLAIISIFALVTLRELLREIDHSVSRQETATLKAHGQALQQWILDHGCIPAPTGGTNWIEAVGAKLGAETNSVAVNPRHQTRLLMVDSSGWLGTTGLPYVQAIPGSINQPVNARMMIVSSLGQAMPGGLTSYPSATEFAALWNCREGTIPATTAWGGWTGRPEDIKVERIRLDPLFLELRVVTGMKEPAYGRYAIGDPNVVDNAPRQAMSNPARYILRGSMVYLYTSAASGGLLDARQIQTKNSFYRYEDGIWKSSAVGADLPGGLDLAAVVKGFLDATPNTNALNGAAQQQMVTGAMMDFMRGYIAWAQAGFPSGTMKANLSSIQVNMMLCCQQLFKDGGNVNNNFFPINNGPCQ